MGCDCYAVLPSLLLTGVLDSGPGPHTVTIVMLYLILSVPVQWVLFVKLVLCPALPRPVPPSLDFSSLVNTFGFLGM